MKRFEVGFAGFLLLVAVLYGGAALRMPRGDLGYPGPGFFPVVVGAFFVLTALGCLVQSLMAGASSTADPGGGHRLSAETVQLLLWLLGYAVTLEWLGFPFAIFLFTAAAARIFGWRRWLPVAGLALLLAVVSYVMFVSWLKVPLPMGILDTLLD